MEKPGEIIKDIWDAAGKIGHFVVSRLTLGGWTEFDNPSQAHIEHLRTQNEERGTE